MYRSLRTAVHFPAEGSKYLLRGGTLIDTVSDNKCVHLPVEVCTYPLRGGIIKRNLGHYVQVAVCVL
jgi:hypothetical protein